MKPSPESSPNIPPNTSADLPEQQTPEVAPVNSWLSYEAPRSDFILYDFNPGPEGPHHRMYGQTYVPHANVTSSTTNLRGEENHRDVFYPHPLSRHGYPIRPRALPVVKRDAEGRPLPDPDGLRPDAIYTPLRIEAARIAAGSLIRRALHIRKHVHDHSYPLPAQEDMPINHDSDEHWNLFQTENLVTIRSRTADLLSGIPIESLSPDERLEAWQMARQQAIAEYTGTDLADDSTQKLRNEVDTWERWAHSYRKIVHTPKRGRGFMPPELPEDFEEVDDDTEEPKIQSGPQRNSHGRSGPRNRNGHATPQRQRPRHS